MKYTWKHLTDLMDKIIADGFTNEITTETLYEYIARNISISEVTKKKFVKYLNENGFIKLKTANIWTITYTGCVDIENKT